MNSVFDGWTTQIKNMSSDGRGGYCAGGWICRGMTTHAIAANPGLYEAAMGAIERIGGWIIANLNPPERLTYFNPKSGFVHEEWPLLNRAAAVIWANDTGALDIEGFKMVDLLTQGYVPETTAAPVQAREAVCA